MLARTRVSFPYKFLMASFGLTKLGSLLDFPELNFDGGITGDFRNGVQTNFHVNVQGNHRKIIREIGAAATVLVKNVGKALPLKLKGTNAIRRLGVFGSDAGPRPAGPNACSNGARDYACNEGTLAMGWGSGTASVSLLHVHVRDVRADWCRSSRISSTLSRQSTITCMRAKLAQPSKACWTTMPTRPSTLSLLTQMHASSLPTRTLARSISVRKLAMGMSYSILMRSSCRWKRG